MKYLYCIAILNFCLITAGLLYQRAQRPESAPQAMQSASQSTQPAERFENPPKREHVFPTQGLTVPNAMTYSQSSSGTIRRLPATLKSIYFKCYVLSEIDSGGKRYYLIRLNEPTIRPDVFIVDEKGVFIFRS